MADFLDEKLKEIQQRLSELRPMVEEYRRLEQAEQVLGGVEASSPGGAPSAAAGTSRATRRAPSPRRGRGGRAATTASNGRRGRPRGSGTRATEALELVRSRPGITIPEIAQAMGIQQNYLYRVMPTLADQGMVVKSGRGWHPREGAPQEVPAEVSERVEEPAEG